MAVLLSTLFFLLALLLINPSPSAANERNVLATGDVLLTDGELSYNGNVLVIQGDCNLVLYNKAGGFQSNTHGRGTNCTLTLSEYGELIIKDGSGSRVWSTPGRSYKGEYSAVLGPDGQVTVFGPAVWSTPPVSALGHRTVGRPDADAVPNLMFSSQVLYENSELASRDYTLAVTEECNLELRKGKGTVTWESKTKGNGEHCFLRLNHRGQLDLVDDRYTVLWSSPPAAADGKYVLILQINGQAVVYGPPVWSTAGNYRNYITLPSESSG